MRVISMISIPIAMKKAMSPMSFFIRLTHDPRLFYHSIICVFRIKMLFHLLFRSLRLRECDIYRFCVG